MTNPFNAPNAHLGDLQAGIDRESVDHLFRNSQVTTPCIICSGQSKYKIIPRHKHLNTAQIQDKGFICASCMQLGHLDPSQYGLREL